MIIRCLASVWASVFLLCGTVSFALPVRNATDPHIQVSRQYFGEDIGPGDLIHLGTATVNTSDTQAFEIENIGGADALQISSLTVTGTCFSKTLSPTTSPIPPGGTTLFKVRFLCSQPGTYTGTVTIQSNDPVDGSLSFQVQEQALLPATLGVVDLGTGGDLTAGSLISLPAQELGGSTVRSFQLENRGDYLLRIFNPSSVVSNPCFTQGGNLPSTLVPGASANLDITYACGSVGIHTATVTVDSDDPNQGSFSWQLQGTVSDPVRGRSSALWFDGADNHVLLGDPAELDLTDTLTLEAWVLPVSGNSAIGIVINKESSYELGITPAGNVKWAFKNTDPGWTWVLAGSVPLGEWSHVAVTYDHGLVTTYINGVSVHTYAGAGAIATSNMSFRIGGREGTTTGQHFLGGLDEVRVWNTVRQPLEILENLHRPVAGSPGLVAEWRFDQGEGDWAADSGASGLAGALVGGAQWIPEERAPFQAASVGPDPSDQLTLGARAGLQAPPALTLEAWIHPRVGSSAGRIVSQVGEYMLALSTQNEIRWILNNSSPGWAFHNTGVTVPTGTWSHVAMTYDGATARTYLDGALVDSRAASGAIQPRVPANGFRVGGQASSTTPAFDGFLDEVRVWNVARTASEIAAGRFTRMTGAEPGLLASWDFDGGDGVKALDRVGDHDLTFAVGTALAGDTRPALARALTLDGSGDYANVGRSDQLYPPSTSLTLEAWIRRSAGTASGVVLAKEGDYLLAVRSNRLQWALAATSPGFVWVDTGVVVPEDVWTHVALVYDGSEARSYLDGALVHTKAVSGSFRPSSDLAFRIGSREAGSGLPFHGDIDEARVWSVARTEAEVQTAMNVQLEGAEPGLLGYWDFDDDGPFVWDRTAAGNHGVRLGDAALTPVDPGGPQQPPVVGDPVFAYWWDHESYRDEPVLWWTLDPNKTPDELKTELLDRDAHRQRFQAEAQEPVSAEELEAVQVYVSGAQRPDLIPAWMAFSALAEEPPPSVTPTLEAQGMSADGIQAVLDALDAYLTAKEARKLALEEAWEDFEAVLTSADVVMGATHATSALIRDDFAEISQALGMAETELAAVVQQGRRSPRIEVAGETLAALQSSLAPQEWDAFLSYLRTDVATRETLYATSGFMADYISSSFTASPDLVAPTTQVSVTGQAWVAIRSRTSGPAYFVLFCGLVTEAQSAQNGAILNRTLAFPRTREPDFPGDTLLTRQQIWLLGEDRDDGFREAVIECQNFVPVPMCWEPTPGQVDGNAWYGYVKMEAPKNFIEMTAIEIPGYQNHTSGVRELQCVHRTIGGTVGDNQALGNVTIRLKLIISDSQGKYLGQTLVTTFPGNDFVMGSLAPLTRYDVIYDGSPNSSLDCTVTNGSGVVGSEDIDDIFVSCACPDPPACSGNQVGYRLGGQLSNVPILNGALVIAADIVPDGAPESNFFTITSPVLNQNGSWFFTTSVLPNSRWKNARVAVQPPGPKECRITQGKDGLVTSPDQTDIFVDCSCVGASCQGNRGGEEEGEQLPDGPIWDDPRLGTPGTGGGGGGNHCQPFAVFFEGPCADGTGWCNTVHVFGCKSASAGPGALDNPSPEMDATVSAPGRDSEGLVASDWLDVSLSGWDPDGVAGFLIGVDATSVAEYFPASSSGSLTTELPSLSLGALSEGPHTLQIIGVDDHATSPSYTVWSIPFTVDSSAAPTPCPQPTAQLSSPVAGAVVSGVVDVTMSGSTQLGTVDTVTLRVDGAGHTVRSGGGPHHVAWDTTGVASGEHDLMVVVTNSCGLSKASPQVPVTVQSDVNHNPIAQDDEVTVQGTTPTVIEVTANDTDPDGDQVVLVGAANFLVMPPAHGTVTKVGPGRVEYQAVAGFVGQDSFQYEVGDNRGKRARAWVTVEVELPEARFPVLADAWANGSPSYEEVNYGTENWLRIRTSGGGHGRHSYLKFQVSGVSGTVRSAKLRIKVRANAVPSMGVWSVPDTGWTETGLNWLNAPIAGAQLVVETGALAAESWHEIDVTSMISGDGVYTIALATSEDLPGLTLYSRESAFGPELVVTYEP